MKKRVIDNSANKADIFLSIQCDLRQLLFSHILTRGQFFLFYLFSVCPSSEYINKTFKITVSVYSSFIQLLSMQCIIRIVCVLSIIIMYKLMRLLLSNNILNFSDFFQLSKLNFPIFKYQFACIFLV